MKNHSEERALSLIDLDKDADNRVPDYLVDTGAVALPYVTIPIAFGMAVVLETIPGTGFERLATSLG